MKNRYRKFKIWKIFATGILLILSVNAYSKEKLKIATCQFPVSGDIQQNSKYIKQFIAEAALSEVDVIQFPETSLSGYAPVDVPSFHNFNWNRLKTETYEIMELAKKYNMWVILGSTHYINENEKPLNCLYIISNEGKIIDRYDKSMLTPGDINYYTPGNHMVTIEIKGYKLGFLICYDSCFPEMYNNYRHKGVEIMFHSFYNARFEGITILDEIIPAQIRVRAADNIMWVIASNSSGSYSPWASCIARPDGSLESLEKGVAGMLMREFPDERITADFKSWIHNNKMMVLPADEKYHNGKPSEHYRAADTKSLP